MVMLSGRSMLWVRLAGLLLIAVVSLWLSTTSLVLPRIDLTEDKLYTFSDGTRNLLEQLEQPVELWWFSSEQQLRESPSLRNYALRVEDMLGEMSRLSGGKLSVRRVDPAPFSVDEDRATQWGLQAVPVEAGQPALYLGLVALGANGAEEAIPFLHPNRQRFLEYDIVRIISRVARLQPPTIGLISTLPVNGGVDMARRTVHRPWTALRELAASYQVDDLGTELAAIPESIDMLLLIQPGALSPAAWKAIDQFVLSGKPALLFIDPDPQGAPAPLALPPGGGGAVSADGLHALFKAWGVRWSGEQVVADAAHAMLVNVGDEQTPARDLTLLGLGREVMAKQALITRDLEVLNVATAGAWQVVDDASSHWQPLVWSSRAAALLDRARLLGLDNPNALFDDFVPDGQRHAMMGLLTGRVSSAYADGGALQHGQIKVLLVGDTDVLTDRLWVQVQGFLGQPVLAPFADNGSLLINAADYLSGSEELIGVRGRGELERPFTRLHELRREAELRYRDRADELSGQLQQAEQALARIQSEAADTAALDARQQALASDYIDRKLALRESLREVRRQLTADIDVLAARLKLLNIILVPALLTVLLLLWHGYRRLTLRRTAAL